MSVLLYLNIRDSSQVRPFILIIPFPGSKPSRYRMNSRILNRFGFNEKFSDPVKCCVICGHTYNYMHDKKRRQKTSKNIHIHILYYNFLHSKCQEDFFFKQISNNRGRLTSPFWCSLENRNCGKIRFLFIESQSESC